MPKIPRTLLVGLLLSALVLISYLPAKLLGISVNPLYRYSGLVSHNRPGIAAGLPIIDPNTGTTTQALGKLSADEWLRGKVPWWNRYAGVGMPLAAEMQSGSFFLPFVLLLHFSNGILYLKVVLQVIAGVASFLLLRQLNLGFTAAFVGATFYTFNGTFSWFAHGEITPLAFLPLFLLGIERARATAEKERPGGWVLIAVSIALSIYAGFPETAFMDGLLAFLWMLVRLQGVGKGKRRSHFLLKICVGGIAGLLVTAPLVVPFFEYLQQAAVAHDYFGDIGLPKSSFLQLFLPYVYGPIMGFNAADSLDELIVDWGNIGGYFGITIVFLCLFGLIAERRERAIRILLGVWIVLLVARSINAPGTNYLFHLIPGMKFIAIYRNSSGSFEMAAAILAAFAVDRWRSGRPVSQAAIVIPTVGTLLLVGAGLKWGEPMMRRLSAGSAQYGPWLWGSTVFGLLLLALIAILFTMKASRKRAQILTLVVAAECVALYAVPLLSGLRDVQMDLAPVSFLRDHLGLQRAYSLAGIRPNYGSYYRLPFIDYESVPVSGIWVTYLRQKLDPDVRADIFSGEYPPTADSRARALRTNLGNFEDTGVRYIVAPRNSNPLEEKVTLPHAPNGNIPVYLNEGQQISGTLVANSFPSRSVAGLTVSIGTEDGKATGSLQLQLCQSSHCVQSEAGLAGAFDNSPLPFPFAEPFSLDPAVPLQYKLTHVHSGHPVAIWMFPSLPNSGQATLPDGVTVSRTPKVELALPKPNGQDKLVLSTATEDVFELSHFAPYFDGGGSCATAAESEERLRTQCRAPSTLIRRELFYPGWRAFVNNREVPVLKHSIFQSIAVPAGKSDIEFRYVPTHSASFSAAALLGLGITIAGGFRGRRASQARPDSRSTEAGSTVDLL